MSFVHFFVVVFVVYLLNCKNFKYILDTGHFHTYYLKMFTPILCVAFHFLEVSFGVQNILILMKSNILLLLIIFLFFMYDMIFIY